ncbi:MAG: hypothetical protein DRJ31_07960 [Candidatus Methanomethylicota archaeon]|uniref:Transcription regulator AsnC/Lrp ligand binding domain-containing protein n=1 Tax=Thermoproteota archaeon TaxID=2056631 RepID=A0A497F2C0_9CREN|nr:MAG: hypothetical protein DRJ31_07960 [Candidatus Verstraetearchaeota archaeon]RLE53655.1 MAG: hypothetical protein DRJ33_00360 [Candidatus Verstraetearchaeota archaeon]
MNSLAVYGYVLVRCGGEGAFEKARDKIAAIRGVKSVTTVTGEWDLVVEVEAGNLRAFGKVALRIAKTPGVAHSESLVAIEV